MSLSTPAEQSQPVNSLVSLHNYPRRVAASNTIRPQRLEPLSTRTALQRARSHPIAHLDERVRVLGIALRDHAHAAALAQNPANAGRFQGEAPRVASRGLLLTAPPPSVGGGGRVAPRVGFEPTTLRLTAGCSTIELPRNGHCARRGRAVKSWEGRGRYPPRGWGVKSLRPQPMAHSRPSARVVSAAQDRESRASLRTRPSSSGG